MNSDPQEIIFTKNATESINIVVRGIKWNKGDKIIVSNMEHHSNLVPWLNLQDQGVEIKIIKADENGVIDPGEVEKTLDDHTRLVTITHINNSIGSVQPVNEISKILEDQNVFYLVDAAQSAGHINIDLKKLKADFVAFPGHKGLLGPVGTGFLYYARDSYAELNPLNLGEAQLKTLHRKILNLQNHQHVLKPGLKT